MDPALWDKVKQIAGEALDLPSSERSAFLDGACDAEVRQEVDRILHADSGAADDFLEPHTIKLERVERGPEVQGDADSSRLVGRSIGRYRVRRLIGAGGMGAVYEAVQDVPRRIVALKVMREGLASRTAMRRFEYEAQMLARLRHPGVAQVYDAGTHELDTGSVPYFAMEYIQGARPLTEYATSKNLSTRERLALFVHVCDAVHHGHQKGIIHRDIKPSNILVDSSGHPRIIDFGVARATDADVAVTTMRTDVGQLIGTLQYMSPEQCAGDAHDIDTRSDVYSLGIVLYELLTSKLPYTISGISLPEAARMIREAPPVRLTAVDRLLRGDIETITLKAIEKDRERRYASAASLGSDIARYLANQPIVARPPSVIYQLSVFARRNRPLIIAASLVLATLIAGVIGTGLGLLRAVAERESAKKAELSSRDAARRSMMVASFLKETLAATVRDSPLMLSPVDPKDIYTPWDVLRPSTDRPPRSGAPTVPELLLEAADRAQNGFINEPLVRAEIEDLIGQAMLQRGMNAPARDILLKAKTTRKDKLGLADEATIRSCVGLATTYGMLGDIANCEASFREGVEGATKLYGPHDHRTRAIVRSLLGTQATDPARLDSVIDAQRRDIADLSAAKGVDDPLVSIEASQLAFHLGMKGRSDEAESLARQAYQKLKTALGDQHRATADAAYSLVEAMRIKAGKQRLEESEELHRLVESYYVTHFGPDGVNLNEIRRSHVFVLCSLQRWADAERVARSMYDSYKRTLGEHHYQTIKSAARIARILLSARTRPQEAYDLALAAVKGTPTEPPLGDEEDYAVYHATTLALAELALGRTDQAEAAMQRLYERAIAHEPRVNAPWALAYLHEGWAEVLMARGKPSKAEPVLIAGLGLIDAWKDPTHPVRVSILLDLIQVCEKQGNMQAAAAWRIRLPSAMQEAPGK